MGYHCIPPIFNPLFLPRPPAPDVRRGDGVRAGGQPERRGAAQDVHVPPLRDHLPPLHAGGGAAPPAKLDSNGGGDPATPLRMPVGGGGGRGMMGVRPHLFRCTQFQKYPRSFSNRRPTHPTPPYVIRPHFTNPTTKEILKSSACCKCVCVERVSCSISPCSPHPSPPQSTPPTSTHISPPASPAITLSLPPASSPLRSATPRRSCWPPTSPSPSSATGTASTSPTTPPQRDSWFTPVNPAPRTESSTPISGLKMRSDTVSNPFFLSTARGDPELRESCAPSHHLDPILRRGPSAPRRNGCWVP